MLFASAREVVRSVKDLCSLPDIYLQLQKLLQDPHAVLDDIARVISQDPALSARLLRIVNSPVYGFQSHIETLPRAIIVVGLEDLQHLVLATTVMDRFDSLPAEWVDMTAFWMRSVHCALVCKRLANSSAALHADRLFLAGLLHDVGSLALYQTMPDQALRVLRATNHDRRLLIGIEQTLIGFTHAEVGRELLKSWGLPESLYNVVGDYPEPSMAQSHKLDAYILNLACRLVDNQALGISATDTADALDQATRDSIRLNREQIADIMEQTEIDFLQIFDVFTAGNANQGKSKPN